MNICRAVPASVHTLPSESNLDNGLQGYYTYVQYVDFLEEVCVYRQ